jgi:copper oxidase (laccase) domain-containing protein
MITKDQPTIFPQNVLAVVSSASDGNMKKGSLPPEEIERVEQNRYELFERIGISPEQVTLVSLSYAKDDFRVYWEATSDHKGKGIVSPDIEPADALVTREKGIALFLMLTHLGRHNIEQHGGQKSVDYLVDTYDSKPEDIDVWLGPAAGKETYPLFSFNNRSMHEVIIEQMTSAGIQTDNIEVSLVDVAKTQDYFSHSEFLKGHRDSDGRFVAIAMLK